MRRSIEDRFWSYVDRSGGPDACWPWTGGRFDTGYGCFSITHRRSVGAHRMALQLTIGREFLPEECVCHSCDNRPCCNPAHLFAGTHADNMKDAASKGRLALQVSGLIARLKGEDHPNSKLTEDDVRSIRALAEAGLTQRLIAKRFNITPPSVGYIVRRIQWRHVK